MFPYRSVLRTAFAGCALLTLPGLAPAGDLPTLQLRPQALARSYAAEGTIEALRQAVVAAQVQGRVLEARVDAGAHVRQGDVLLRIDTREADQAVAAAAAQVAAAQARLVDARAGLERSRSLKARSFISASALDQAQAAFDTAQAQQRAAEAGRAQAEAGRSFATVTAPLTGVVAQRLTEPGEMALPGKPLMIIHEPGGLRAVVDLPQARLADLSRPGVKARVEFPESGRWLESASIQVLPAADPRTHTARIRVNLPAEAPGVVPGMAARVHFSLPGEAPVLTVPAAAILRRGELSGVYVADGKGAFVLRQVRLGSTQADGSVEILAGLAGGEELALDPVRAGLLRRKP